MLTPLLLAAALTPAFQDATAEPLPPQEPAAAQDAGGAIDAFMADVFARQYDPTAHGLTSLSFVLPLNDPMLGHQADTIVTWAADSEASMQVNVLDFEIPEQMRAQLQMMGATEDMLRQQAQFQAEAAANQFLDQMLGRGLQGLLGPGASMGDMADGNMVVVLPSSGDPNDPTTERRLHIDGDSLLVKHEIDMAGPMGSQTVTNVYEWQPAPEGDQIVQASQAVKMGTPMGEMELNKTSFRYQQVGDMLLLVEQVTSNGQMMGGGSATSTVRDLVVNGTPVATGGEGREDHADGDGDAAGHQGDGHEGHDHG